MTPAMRISTLIENGLERSDGFPAQGFLVVPGVEVSHRGGGISSASGRCSPTCVEDRSPRSSVPSKTGAAWRFPPSLRSLEAGIPEDVLDRLNLKAIEVFNAAARKDFNEQALAYATGRDLSMTASSDAHHASAVAVSFTHFELEDLNLAELLRAVRKGGTPGGTLSLDARGYEEAIRRPASPGKSQAGLKVRVAKGSAAAIGKKCVFSPRSLPPVSSFQHFSRAARRSRRSPRSLQLAPRPPAPTPEPIDLNSEVIVLCYHRFEDKPKDSLASNLPNLRRSCSPEG